MPLSTFRLSCVPLLVLLASWCAWAQAPHFQDIQPIEPPGAVFATVPANGSIYLVGSIARVAGYDPESGPYNSGHNAYVAKWNPATRRLVWVLEMGNNHQDDASALVVRDSCVYILGQFSRVTEGFGHPLKGSGNYDGFVTKLTDHGTSATVNWTQPFGRPGTNMFVRQLALSGSALYVSGIITTTTNPLTGITPPDTTRAFVLQVTDAGTQAVPGWRYTWETNRYYQSMGALVAQRGKVYVAASTWQATPDRPEPQSTLALGALPHRANYRMRLIQLSDQGSSYHLDWTHIEAGEAADLAVVGDTLYVAGRGAHLYLAGTFGAPSLNLGAVVLPNASPRGDSPQSLFVAQLAVTSVTSRFDWAERLGNNYKSELKAFALDGARLYLRGDFQGFYDQAVLLGEEQVHFPGLSRWDLLTWLPLVE
jgi:hypothetical protein